MKFQPPFERRDFDPQTAPPYGRKPDGQWIFSSEDLPFLPIPKHAVVTKEYIEFDGWVFPLAYVTRSLLVWLQQTFIRWSKEDDSENEQGVDQWPCGDV